MKDRSKRTAHTQPTARRAGWLRVVLTAGAVAGVVLAVIWLVPLGEVGPSEAELIAADYANLDAASGALKAGQFSDAERLATQVRREGELGGRALLVAAEAASRETRWDDAAKYYEAAIALNPRDKPRLSFFLAEVRRTQGQLQEASDHYQAALSAVDFEGDSHSRLAFLYSVTGQRWRAAPHYLALIQRQQWTLDSLVLLGDLERPIEQPQFIAQCLANNPDGLWVLLGQAQIVFQAGDEANARKLLAEITQADPNLLSAQATLGELMMIGDPADYARWHQSLPHGADQDPDIWFVRGTHARASDQLDVAAGCFIEALRLCPEHRRANYQLGQVLTALEHPAAPAIVKRAADLLELSQVLDEILKSRGESERAIRRAAEISADNGRWWEAWAWALTATKFHPQADWATALRSQAEPRLKADLPRTALDAELVKDAALDILVNKAVDASKRESQQPSSDPLAPSVSPGDHPRFAKTDVGIDFIYQNGADPATPGARMFEQTGGGVGVIDYDLDGWPDLYFTQGGTWKTGESVPTPDAAVIDQLFRNVAGKRYESVTQPAGAINTGFGQGVSIGDIDADGFPDIYVGNIGANKLYHNNGDGTFNDVSDWLDQSNQRWTTSCAIADLNGDGLSDIYDVNYLMGDQVFTLICGEKACSPKVFSGAPDEVHVNLGNARFAKVTDSTPQQEAKGLGILVARFSGERLPELFIANDQVANFFLRPELGGSLVNDNLATAVIPTVKYTDRALLQGLAYNMDGLAMACMGIAADDLDGNGLLDMLVTNFMDEPNSLYLQDAPGLFVDATRAAGLQGPSFPYVGWGTQFLDADLDGDSDLVVVNGHVDDYRDENKLYHMPPQLFVNQGRSRFELVVPESAGNYFQDLYLGRGLARLDWNRDGRPEFVVSHIGQPAALIENRTDTVGNFLNVELVGTYSSRDPIGAEVELIAGNRRWRKQLVAGDGFLASNERVLQFGLGSLDHVDELIITWPSGNKTHLASPPVGQRLLVAEERTEGVTREGTSWTATFVTAE